MYINTYNKHRNRGCDLGDFILKPHTEYFTMGILY